MIATIIWICLQFGGFVVHCVNFGEEIKQKYNPFTRLIVIAINVLIGYYMGIFNNLK